MAPQYHPGDFVYQRDSKFRRITLGNFGVYTRLGEDLDFTYTLDPQHTVGFVFENAEIEQRPRQGLLPVMHVHLRESPVSSYKQAYRLRIRESFARKNAATAWYLAYVATFGGVVSDFDHLEGGKSLWRSLVNIAQDRGQKASLLDTTTGARQPVNADTPDPSIWSADQSKRHLVLVLEKP